VLQENDEVTVEILGFKDKGRAALSMKGLNPHIDQKVKRIYGENPREATQDDIGKEVIGHVTSQHDFGLFIKCAGMRRDGLCRVEELPEGVSLEDAASKKGPFKVKIIGVQCDGRIGLTMKGEGLGLIDGCPPDEDGL